MLSKYHNFPDHFHDLKTTLQAEFDLLKKATSKNIQNIQEVVQSQQAYTTALFGHINTLYPKLVQLDKQVQIQCLYQHPQPDIIWLNTPDHDPDIDGELDPATDIQSPNAESTKEDTLTDTSKSEHRSDIPPTTNRPEHQPSKVSADTDHPEYHSSEQPRAEHPSNYCPNWKTSQNLRQMKKTGMKASLMMQSSLITITPLRKVIEYIVSTLLTLKKLKTKNTALTIPHKALNTRSLNWTTTTLIHNQNSTRDIKTKMSIYLPLPPLKICIHGVVADMEEPGIWNCIATGCMGRKPGH